MKLPITKLVRHQKKQFSKTFTDEHEGRCIIIATVRHDDECGNKHNSFSVTGEIWRASARGEKRGRDCITCGCIHDEIIKHFPELEQYIKWHLMGTDQPMHYVSNTMYHAGNKDCNGGMKGEIRDYSYALRFSGSPISHKIKKSFNDFIVKRRGTGDFNIQEVQHKDEPGGYKFGPKYTFAGYGGVEWYECPFDTRPEAEEWQSALNNTMPGFIKFLQVPTLYHEGKERELNAARESAVWPEATDKDLTAPGLRVRLEKRLPALMADFKTAVESLDLVY